MKKIKYSEFLSANGVDPKESPIIERFGDNDFIHPDHLSDIERDYFLNGEREMRALKDSVGKAEIETQEQLKARQSASEIKDLISAFVRHNYPEDKFKEEYRGIYNGLVIGMTNSMFQRAEFEVENGELKIKGQAGRVNKKQTELERLIDKAKIDLSKPETIEDLLDESFSERVHPTMLQFIPEKKTEFGYRGRRRRSNVEHKGDYWNKPPYKNL